MTVECTTLMEFLDQTHDRVESAIKDISGSFVLGTEARLIPTDKPKKKSYIVSRKLPRPRKRNKHRIDKKQRAAIVQEVERIIEEQYSKLRDIMPRDKYNVGVEVEYRLANKVVASLYSCECYYREYPTIEKYGRYKPYCTKIECP